MPSNEFIFDLSKNSAKAAENITAKAGLKLAKETAKRISVIYPQGEIYEVIDVNLNVTYNLSKYSGYSYTYSPGGLDDSEPVGGDLYLPNGMGTRFGAKLDSVVSILPGKSNTLQKGDMVEVGFYDRNRQRPYIKRILKRGPFTHESDVIVVIYKIANELWTQAEACLRKDNVGVFLAGTAYGGSDMALSPTLYDIVQTINYPVANLAHGINEGLYPHGIVYYDGMRIVIKQLYTENGIQGYDVYFQDLATEANLEFFDAEAPLTTLTFLHFDDIQSMGTGSDSYRYREPTSLIYLNEQSKGFLHIIPQCLLPSGSFKVFNIDLTKLRTEGKITKTISSLGSRYGLGGAEVSITNKLMIQTSDPGFSLWKTTDYLNWTVVVSTVWDSFRSAPPSYSTEVTSGIVDLPYLANPSAARWRKKLVTTPVTWEYSNFICAINVVDKTAKVGGITGSLVGNAALYGARLINVEVKEDGTPGTSKDALTITPLTLGGLDSRIIDLTNIIDQYNSQIKAAHYSDYSWDDPHYAYPGTYPVSGWASHGETETFICTGAINYNYYACASPCLQLEDCGGFIGNGCSKYHIHQAKVRLNNLSHKFTYKGPHKLGQMPTAARITMISPGHDYTGLLVYTGVPGDTGDKDYPYPSLPYESEVYPSICQLPSKTANTSQYPGLNRCKWSPDDNGNRHVVFNDKGSTIQACLRSTFIREPFSSQVQLDEVKVKWQIENYGTPIPFAFPQFISWTFYDVQTGCDDCNGPNGYQRTPNYLVGNAGTGTYLLDNGAIGHETVWWEGWWRTKITPVFETVLVVSSSDRTSHNSIVISESFTGAKYPGWKYASWTEGDPIPDPLNVSTLLNCPENVWQIIPVDDKVLVLMDYRDDFKSSPIPCLKCYIISDGAISAAGEYRNLISSDIGSEKYTEDTLLAEWIPPTGGIVTYNIYKGDAKWYFHGKHTAGGQVISSFSGETPGPKMKVLWASRAQAGGYTDNNGKVYKEGEPIPGDTIVMVSCECYEKKPYPPYDFKSRVEFRILKITALGLFEELFSGFDEVDNSCLITERAWEVVKFSSDYPKPNTLVNMAVAGEFFEYMHQDRTDPTKWTIRRKS